jgi:hypothetical protein
MIDNYIAIVTLHYQKISMRIFTITAYIQSDTPIGYHTRS